MTHKTHVYTAESKSGHKGVVMVLLSGMDAQMRRRHFWLCYPHEQHVCVQVLVVGKISQAAVLAASAYRNNDTFKTQTGLIKSRLIYDKQHHDTKVQPPYLFKIISFFH